MGPCDRASKLRRNRRPKALLIDAMHLPTRTPHVRHSLPLIAAALIQALAGLAAPALAQAPAPAASAAAKAALSVEVVSPVSAQVPVTLQANGNIAAWQEAIVDADLVALAARGVLALELGLGHREQPEPMAIAGEPNRVARGAQARPRRGAASTWSGQTAGTAWSAVRSASARSDSSLSIASLPTFGSRWLTPSERSSAPKVSSVYSPPVNAQPRSSRSCRS